MLGAGDARVALKAGSKNASSINTGNSGVDPETFPYRYGFYPRHHSPAIDTGDWLTSPTRLIVTPLLSHLLNYALFRIAGFNHLGDKKYAGESAVTHLLF